MRSLSRKEAAAALGVSEDTIDRRVKSGELDSVRETQGRQTRVRILLPDAEDRSGS